MGTVSDSELQRLPSVTGQSKSFFKRATTCECDAAFTSTFCWLSAKCVSVESKQPDVCRWPPATGHAVWQRLRGQELCQDTSHPLRMSKPRWCFDAPELFLHDARSPPPAPRNAEPNNKTTPRCLFCSDIICLSFIGVGLSGLLCLWRAINFNRAQSGCFV